MYVIVAGAGRTARIRRDLGLNRDSYVMVSHRPDTSFSRGARVDRIGPHDIIVFTDDPNLDQPEAIIESLLQRCHPSTKWCWITNNEYFMPGYNVHRKIVGDMRGTPILTDAEHASRVLLHGLGLHEDDEEDDVTVEHQFDLEFREADTGSPMEYRWACSCGSHSSAWRRTRAQARAGHERHLARERARA